MYIFPLKCEGAEVLRHIFPSKQRAVQKTIDIAKSDERINRVIVFGSAVTMQCGADSDIDIAIDNNCPDEDSFAALAGVFYREVPSEIDVINYNRVNSDLLKENIEKGVCVYAKQ